MLFLSLCVFAVKFAASHLTARLVCDSLSVKKRVSLERMYMYAIVTEEDQLYLSQVVMLSYVNNVRSY